MLLYIRHGKKVYGNKTKCDFPLDSPLSESGGIEAYQKFEELLQTAFIPDMIICSPFLRTRQTASIAQDVIKEHTGQEIEIYCDPNIGEYLGNVKHIKLSENVYPETYEFRPLENKSFEEFNRNINTHLNEQYSNVWYITHGLVIKTIAEKLGYTIDHPDEVSGFILDDQFIII